MRIPTSKVVLHADVVFEVWSDDKKLGELRVSQGGVDWRPGNAQIAAKLRWEQFDVRSASMYAAPKCARSVLPVTWFGRVKVDSRCTSA